jgi:mannose-6-phosphate isomerase-like protein (cupin superfamily)
MLNTTNFETFEREAKAAGYDEVLQRDWESNTVLPEHTHPFDAYAVVTQGEMWLTSEGSTRHITPGGAFSVPKGTPHAERYGSLGASYWVARRN